MSKLRSSASQHEHFYIVAYDVADDRRRERLATTLLDVGVRVGLSLFHARLAPREAEALLDRAAALIDRQTDRVHLYRLCLSRQSAAEFIGRPWGGQAAIVAVV